MFMDSSLSHSLSALLVFENTLNKELMRSLHVYRLEDGSENEVEREFVFKSEGSYVEIEATPLLTLQDFLNKELFQGHVFGLWACIFAFHATFPPNLVPIPPILSISRNHKLKSIASLANDLQIVSWLSSRTEDELSQSPSEETPEIDIDNSHLAKNSLFDLNYLPQLHFKTELTDYQQIDQTAQALNSSEKITRKKRAAVENIDKISFEELVKYFDRPIIEASRVFNVGLTRLKKKCRELGIRRWPHRKIKSLDILINILQEDAARRLEPEGMAAVMGVEKMQSMLQKEKESIEREPLIELQTMTKKFRQHIFKRRYKARVLEKDQNIS